MNAVERLFTTLAAIAATFAGAVIGVWAVGNAMGFRLSLLGAGVLILLVPVTLWILGNGSAATPPPPPPPSAPRRHDPDAELPEPKRRLTVADAERAVILFEKGLISRAQLNLILAMVVPPEPLPPTPPRRPWWRFW